MILICKYLIFSPQFILQLKLFIFYFSKFRFHYFQLVENCSMLCFQSSIVFSENACYRLHVRHENSYLCCSLLSWASANSSCRFASFLRRIRISSASSLVRQSPISISLTYVASSIMFYILIVPAQMLTMLGCCMTRLYDSWLIHMTQAFAGTMQQGNTAPTQSVSHSPNKH